MPFPYLMSAPGHPMEESWLKHKEDIYHYYIAQGLTLKSTMDIMKNRHGFNASTTQYTTKLKAWGYTKNNKSSLYPCIKGSLKRKEIDLDAVESVAVSTDSGERVISRKKLKKAFARPSVSKRQVGSLDAPSPPGFQVRYQQQQPQSSGFESPDSPFTILLAELVSTRGLPKASSTQAQAAQEELIILLDWVRIPHFRKITKLLGAWNPALFPIQLLSSLSAAFKSLSVAQSCNLTAIFQAMFLLSNNQLTEAEERKFGEWLIQNVRIGSLCRLQSWTAKAVLTCLLHGAVEMDAIAVLREAHLRGVNLESPSSRGFKETLLQHSLSRGSVQCAKYLIDAGVDVSAGLSIQQSTDSFKANWHPEYCNAPLGLASRTHRCVDLVSALLARGASPKGMLLLKACVRSSASLETIESLIHAGVSPDEQGGLTAAASLGRCDIMELLISAGARIEGGYSVDVADRTAVADYIRSPAIAAAGSRCIDSMEFLIHKGIDLNASLLDGFNVHDRAMILDALAGCSPRSLSEEPEFYPIQAAILADDCSFVEYLIKKGASLTPRYGPPPLVLAAHRKNVAMITLLLTHGANPNNKSEIGPAVSALEVAAKMGCLQGIQRLVKAGADLDFCCSRRGSRTPLQRAAESRQVGAVELLIEYGADINAPPCPDDGVSTLQCLIQCKRLDWVVRALAANASVNSLPGTIGSPLLAAINTGNSDLVALLIRLGADVRQSATDDDSLIGEWFLPLQLAARNGDLHICKMLVEAGAEVDGVVEDEDDDDDDDRDDWDKKTPLTLACGAGEESVARYLISKMACLGGKSNSYLDTPYYSALDGRHIDIVRLLLQSGLDPNDFYGGFDTYDRRPNRKKRPTPLITACKGPDGMLDDDEEDLEIAYSLAELMIQYGADTNYRPSLSFNTPLQIACLKQNWKLTKLLLSHGADVNAPCSIRVDHHRIFVSLGQIPTGFNAFQAVILSGNMDIVELFLSSGAGVYAPEGSSGRVTALQAAVQQGNVQIADKLLKAGARVDEPPAADDGRTAIQSAAELGRLEMLSLLLCHYQGTQPIWEICDDAIEFALKERHDIVVGFLREYKEQHFQPPVAERQSPWEFQEWINGDWVK